MDMIKEIAMDIATLIDEKKGQKIKVLDVRGLCSLTDYMIIASGTSDRHVSSIADGIEDGMKKKLVEVGHIEGQRLGEWIILDFLDVVVHIFKEEFREFYDLEHIWNEAKNVDILQITEVDYKKH